jgi:prolipoprotein diacylglyceryltransferase
MGQILSVPLVLVGVFILIRASQGKFKTADNAATKV